MNHTSKYDKANSGKYDKANSGNYDKDYDKDYTYDAKELLKEQLRISDREADDDVQLQSKYNNETRRDAADSKRVNLANIFGMDSSYRVQRALHPQIQYTRNYVVLDSKNRIPSQSRTRMSWNYLSNAIFQQGTVNTKGQVRDLIGMRVYPLVMAQNSNTSGIYNPTLTLLIEEFAAQAFTAQQKRNYHFMFRNATNYVDSGGFFVGTINKNEYIPLNDGYFWFRKPYTEISSFTISLANPLVVVNVPIPEIQVYSSSFSAANPTVIQADAPIPFATGSTVVVRGFTTGNPVADAAQITAINDLLGHIATIDPFDDTRMTIPVNLIGITPVSASSTIPVYITDESSRVIIPLELIYIQPDSESNDS